MCIICRYTSSAGYRRAHAKRTVSDVAAVVSVVMNRRRFPFVFDFSRVSSHGPTSLFEAIVNFRFEIHAPLWAA